MIKNIFIFLVLFLFPFNIKSQDQMAMSFQIGHRRDLFVSNADSALHICFTTGMFYGGGALFGFEFENKFFNRIGIQHGYGCSFSKISNPENIGLLHLGVNYISFGAGLNYHLKPTLRSSYISFQYWTQGVFDEFLQSVTGPVFVYRSKKFFTAQIGLGYVITKKPVFQYQYVKAPFMITYAIGFYLVE